jgi:hypothetical protein
VVEATRILSSAPSETARDESPLFNKASPSMLLLTKKSNSPIESEAALSTTQIFVFKLLFRSMFESSFSRIEGSASKEITFANFDAKGRVQYPAFDPTSTATQVKSHFDINKLMAGS